MQVKSDELEVSDDGVLLLWNGAPFDGAEVEHWPDGSVSSEVEYKNGLKHGVAKRWFRSGQLRSEEHHRDGALHGTSREWFESGRPARESEYEFGIRVREKSWDTTGRQVSEAEISEQDPNYSLLLTFRRTRGRS